MNHEQTQANLELVLDWIDALRRGDIDATAERFHPDVAWEDVAGGLACEGREQVLAWLRAAPPSPRRWTRSSCWPAPTTRCSACATTPSRSSPACSSTASCSRSSRSETARSCTSATTPTARKLSTTPGSTTSGVNAEDTGYATLSTLYAASTGAWVRTAPDLGRLRRRGRSVSFRSTARASGSRRARWALRAHRWVACPTGRGRRAGTVRR